MKEKAPAFQFYPKDFVSDEHVVTMTMAQRGVYISLLSFCWLQGSIPNSKEQAARLCGASRQEIDKAWVVVAARFIADPNDTNRLRHKRLDDERKRQQIWAAKSAEGGRNKQRNTATKSQGCLKGGIGLVEPNIKPREEDADADEDAKRSERGTGGDFDNDCQALSEELWKLHPAPSDINGVQMALSKEKYKAVHRERFDQSVIESLTRWTAYWEEAQRFPTGLCKWISSGDYARSPPDVKASLTRKKSAATEMIDRL